MFHSNTLSLPAILLAAGLTLSTPTATTQTLNLQNYSIQSEYKTTSSNPVALEYGKKQTLPILRKEAMSLYGEQTNFTKEERKTYKNMLNAKSQDVGKSVFDFF